MRQLHQFYINGEWVNPAEKTLIEVINPATEQACATVASGSKKDVDHAVNAARNAFQSFGFSSKKQRLDILDSLISKYDKYYDELAEAVTEEMGAPTGLSHDAQVAMGKRHLVTIRDILEDYAFEYAQEQSIVLREPIGVCGLITPWNWPLNQILCKVAPAIAAGCCVILKPSEIAPLSAHVFGKVIHEANVPAGVFNLVHGSGAVVGTALSSHPQIDMMSFTGSKRAGVDIALKSAHEIKRVCQELGGKSPNIILADCDLEQAVTQGTRELLKNSGQSCVAPSRMLVPEHLMESAASIASEIAGSMQMGDPRKTNTELGPVSGKAQFDKIQSYIQQGIDEGATLACGGVGRPAGLETGFYVKPTVFSHVNNRMTIAQEEIFGPVLVIIPYKTEEEAIEIANDTPYGLAAYIQGSSTENVRNIASKIRAGSIRINGANVDGHGPFGGYKESGNGREHGVYGLEEYLELKAIFMNEN